MNRPSRIEPPHPYGYRLALLRCWGREDEADRLLNALNAVQRAFGHPDYIMPEPLEKCGDLEPKKLPNGRYQVAA